MTRKTAKNTSRVVFAFVFAVILGAGLLLISAVPKWIIFEDILKLNYSGRIDTSFLMVLAYTLIFYSVFFVLTLNLTKRIYKKPLSSRFVIGVVLSFLFWRLAAVSLGHVNCVSSCAPTIIPRFQDTIILVLTSMALAYLGWRFYRRQQ